MKRFIKQYDTCFPYFLEDFQEAKRTGDTSKILAENLYERRMMYFITRRQHLRQRSLFRLAWKDMGCAYCDMTLYKSFKKGIAQ